MKKYPEQQTGTIQNTIKTKALFKCEKKWKKFKTILLMVFSDEVMSTSKQQDTQ